MKSLIWLISPRWYAKHGQSGFADFLGRNGFAHFLSIMHKACKSCRIFDFFAINRKSLFSASIGTFRFFVQQFFYQICLKMHLKSTIDFCSYNVTKACSNVQPPGIAKNQLSISDELKKKIVRKNCLTKKCRLDLARVSKSVNSD